MGRWVVKEATYKAFYQAGIVLSWKEISYTTQPHPVVLVRSNNWDYKTHVSVSHDGEYVIASVLAQQGKT